MLIELQREGMGSQLSGVYAPNSQTLSPSTLTYDAAGDVTNDTHTSNTYVYDAEGRISTPRTWTHPRGPRVCAFETPNGLGGTTMVGYLYDGDGTRVATAVLKWELIGASISSGFFLKKRPPPMLFTKSFALENCSKGTITSMNCDPASNGFQLTEDYVLGPSGEELTMLNGSGTWQRSNVYGGGRQVATYDIAANPAYVSGNGQPTTAPALHFQILDGLGTRRVQTNADGQPETDIQSLPYGDALVTANDEYAPVTADDATPLHFTGKERDSESGNDYFGARYYASNMGRWLIPDWSAKVEPVPYAEVDDPQSLNLYSYVGNNPLTRDDPDGHRDPSSKSKGRTTTITHADGSTEKRTGNIAYRDNNPGNLRPYPFVKNNGMIGEDHPVLPGGKTDKVGFAVFEDSAQGEKALRALLGTKSVQNRSIADEMEKFAPNSDGNDPKAYAASLAKALGVDVSEKMSSLTSNQLDTFVETVKQKEGFNDPKGKSEVVK